MILTIDNFDGHGPIDYSNAICADAALKLTRVLNKPSILVSLFHQQFLFLDCCSGGTEASVPPRAYVLPFILRGSFPVAQPRDR